MGDTAALIMAAGTADRFGGSEQKQFCPVGGRAVLVWAVERFSQTESIAGVTIVVTPDHEERAARLIEQHGLRKVDSIIPGGRTRQESVRLGLEALAERVEYVLVHDAARPCVSAGLIERVRAALEASDAVIPTMPTVDTLVREVDETVDAVLDRVRISSVQTPQGFRKALLLRAHRHAVSVGLSSSDDGSLVLALGEPVKTIPGEITNMKITYREDLNLAEAILSRRV